ncbi:MAG: OmpA family protein [Bacteroidota bacterium]
MYRFSICLISCLCWFAAISQEGSLPIDDYSLPSGAELLGPQINAPYDDFRPFISPDGLQLYFSRKNHPQNIGRSSQDDIWLAHRQQQGSWKRAIHIGAPINNRQDNQVVGLSPSGSTLWLVNKDRNTGKLSLHQTQRNGRSWTRPMNMPIEGVDQLDSNSFLQVCPNGELLLLSLYSPSSNSTDLFISFRQAGMQWSRPTSLGNNINTPGKEKAAFLAADNRTLYFTSNGHGGQGGQDLFISRRLGDDWSQWSTPLNMGATYNTPQDDPICSIPAEGDYAYFGRRNPEGSSDLYRIQLTEDHRPEPIVLVKGKVVDSQKQYPVSGKLQVQQIGDQQTSSNRALRDGQYSLLLPYGQDVRLSAEMDGYFPTIQYIELSDQWEEALDGDQQWLAQSTDKKQLPIDLANIERLQLRLNSLDKELHQLEQQQLETARKTAIRQQQKKEFKTYRSDPELESLKHKYEQMILGRKESKERRFTKKSAPTSDDSDKAMNELRRKYARHYDQQASDWPSSAPSTSDKDDEELNRLYKKVDRHYNDREDKDDASAEQALPAPTYSAPAFQVLEGKMRVELEEELRNPVKLQLIDESFNRMAIEFERGLDSEYRPLFSYRLRNLALQNLKDKLVPKGTQKPDRIRKSAPRQQEGSVENVTLSLRNKLYEDVATDLKEELTGEIQNAILRELDYSLKRAIKNKLLKELNAQIKSREQKNQVLKRSKNAIGASPQDLRQGPASREYQELERNIVLFPLASGTLIPLDNIYFDANQSKLLERSYAELDRVAKILQRYPSMRIEIGGHTNGLVSYSFAHLLSTQRAEAVVQYLIQKGVDATRIQARGYGSTLPLASNENPEGRRKNQRIELKIIEY